MDDELYEQLQQLEEYPNITQLEILQKEIRFIMENEYMPPLDWFDERIDKIYQYNNLNWEELHQKYINKDSYMHTTSFRIKEMLDKIINEWSGNSQFNLQIYHLAIDCVYYIWKHYEANYVKYANGDSMDSDDECKGSDCNNNYVKDSVANFNNSVDFDDCVNDSNYDCVDNCDHCADDCANDCANDCINNCVNDSNYDCDYNAMINIIERMNKLL